MLSRTQIDCQHSDDASSPGTLQGQHSGGVRWRGISHPPVLSVTGCGKQLLQDVNRLTVCYFLQLKGKWRIIYCQAKVMRLHSVSVCEREGRGELTVFSNFGFMGLMIYKSVLPSIRAQMLGPIREIHTFKNQNKNTSVN